MEVQGVTLPSSFRPHCPLTEGFACKLLALETSREQGIGHFAHTMPQDMVRCPQESRHTPAPSQYGSQFFPAGTGDPSLGCPWSPLSPPLTWRFVLFCFVGGEKNKALPPWEGGVSLPTDTAFQISTIFPLVHSCHNALPTHCGTTESLPLLTVDPRTTQFPTGAPSFGSTSAKPGLAATQDESHIAFLTGHSYTKMVSFRVAPPPLYL